MEATVAEHVYLCDQCKLRAGVTFFDTSWLCPECLPAAEADLSNERWRGINA
jgi:hypothetical protein